MPCLSLLNDFDLTRHPAVTQKQSAASLCLRRVKKCFWDTTWIRRGWTV